MHKLHITLPDTLKLFMDEQIAKGRYGDYTDYICDLIRADEERLADLQRDALAAEAPPDDRSPTVLGDWRAIRQEAVAQAKRARDARD